MAERETTRRRHAHTNIDAHVRTYAHTQYTHRGTKTHKDAQRRTKTHIDTHRRRRIETHIDNYRHTDPDIQAYTYIEALIFIYLFRLQSGNQSVLIAQGGTYNPKA